MILTLELYKLLITQVLRTSLLASEGIRFNWIDYVLNNLTIGTSDNKTSTLVITYFDYTNEYNVSNLGKVYGEDEMDPINNTIHRIFYDLLNPITNSIRYGVTDMKDFKEDARWELRENCDDLGLRLSLSGVGIASRDLESTEPTSSLYSQLVVDMEYIGLLRPLINEMVLEYSTSEIEYNNLISDIVINLHRDEDSDDVAFMLESDYMMDAIVNVGEDQYDDNKCQHSIYVKNATWDTLSVCKEDSELKQAVMCLVDYMRLNNLN